MGPRSAAVGAGGRDAGERAGARAVMKATFDGAAATRGGAFSETAGPQRAHGREYGGDTEGMSHTGSDTGAAPGDR
ncbi:hypothetical protein [Streptomyces sp. KR55]|uniref:hypothetical protein n=1 Tax=Streptomyces sp. KR55 TaxID=3457425 RepID=UPI003FD53EA4